MAMSNAIYVYAIVSREAPLPAGVSGFGGAPLLAIPRRDLAAVASPVSPGELRATSENVLLHEEVVEAVRREGSALPVRFGAVFSDRDAVTQALGERYEVLAADLERVGDKIELGVTLLWAEATVAGEEPRETEPDLPSALDPAGAEGPGARYMRARLAEHRREAALREKAKALARQLDEMLEEEVLERRHTILPTARLAVRAAYLLEPSRLGTFRALLHRVQRAQPGVRVLLSGPWPPYSFVTAAPETGARRDLYGQIEQAVGSMYRAPAPRYRRGIPD
jgi:hypothetical protein